MRPAGELLRSRPALTSVEDSAGDLRGAEIYGINLQGIDLRGSQLLEGLKFRLDKASP